MEKEMICLRCDTKMEHMMTEELQLGKTSWFLGNWSNLLAGALTVDIFCCPECGKLEFFRASEEPVPDKTPQRTCPECGRVHDFDWPKCPYCRHDYSE